MRRLLDHLSGLIGSRAALSNFQWLLLEKIFRFGLAILVGAWVARHLGPSEFGALSYVVAFIAIFQAGCLLGLDAIVVRDLVQRPTDAAETLGTAMLLRLTAGIACAILALASIVLIRPGDSKTFVLTSIVVGLLLFQTSDTVDLWFQSQLKSARSVLARTIGYAIANAARVFAILVGAQTEVFAWILLLEAAICTASMSIIYLKHPVPGRLLWRTSVARHLIYESWPLLLAGLAVLMYMRLDQIMLRELVGEKELGIYSAAMQMSTAWYFLPMIICSSAAPEMARLRAHSPEHYLPAIGRLFRLMWLISLAIALCVSLASNWLVAILYGTDFSRAAAVLRIHTFAIVPLSLGLVQSLWIAHERRPALALYRTLFGLFTSLLLNWTLIPILGATGSAIAYVLCQFVAAVASNALLAPKMLRLQFTSLLCFRAT